MRLIRRPLIDCQTWTVIGIGQLCCFGNSRGDSDSNWAIKYDLTISNYTVSSRNYSKKKDKI